ncbi:MAG: hypothetical protein H6Q58_738 [Firmicutes bacterium]|nr:hypothetical protein [Bacillota bacterium]
MRYEAATPDEYAAQLTEDRRRAVDKLRETLKSSLPKGIEEAMYAGMIGYVIPLSLYPSGYHAAPGEPLPFMSIASQKNHIALYHMGIYVFPEVLEWFRDEYSKRVKTKLDMAKSCIRFKNPDRIPYELIAELCGKISIEEYISKYEENIHKSKAGR